MNILQKICLACDSSIENNILPTVVRMSNATLLTLRAEEKVPTNMRLEKIELNFGDLKIIGDNSIPTNEIHVLREVEIIHAK